MQKLPTYKPGKDETFYVCAKWICNSHFAIRPGVIKIQGPLGNIDGDAVQLNGRLIIGEAATKMMPDWDILCGDDFETRDNLYVPSPWRWEETQPLVGTVDYQLPIVTISQKYADLFASCEMHPNPDPKKLFSKIVLKYRGTSVGILMPMRVEYALGDLDRVREAILANRETV